MRCAYCDKPVPKWSTTVYVKDKPTQYDVKASWCRYVYLEGRERPKSKADCVRFTNLQVLSIKRDMEGNIVSFNEWDDERYFPKGEFFCKGPCATNFARSAFGAGYRIKRNQQQ